MQTQLDSNVTVHLLWIALPVMLTTLAGQWMAYRANRRRGEEKDRERAEKEAGKDNRLAVLLENYRLHDHGEWKSPTSTGPLHAENMRFPNISADGKD